MPQASENLSPVFGIDETTMTARLAVAAYRQIDARIPMASVIARLPLIPEPLTRWATDNDLYALIANLSSVQTIVTTKGGEQEVDFDSLAADRFSKACAQATNLVKRFAKGPEAPARRVLRQDPAFGAAVKSLAAWDVIAEELLSESACPSLPHLLESSTDLESSAELAAASFYKQASQVLRGFIEGQVVALALAADTDSFHRWRTGGVQDFKSLRGKSGLLRRLQSQGLMEVSLAERISALYGDLNYEVHGSEASFIHSGVFVGTHMGHVFRPDRFRQWCDRIVEAVEVCLHVVNTAVEHWQSSLLDSTVCYVCRSGPLVESDAFALGGKEFRRRQCAACKTEDTIENDTRHRVWVVSQGATLHPAQIDS
jgi:hypothetical protein